MKYDKYDGLREQEKHDAAIKIHESLRGSYLISKALYYAIQEMKKEDRPQRSDICDMMLLRERIYLMYRHMEDEK